jgi:hypothetical protein
MPALDLALRVQEVLVAYAVKPVVLVMLGLFVGKVVQQGIVFLGREFALKEARVHAFAFTVSWCVYLVTIAYALASIYLLGWTLVIASSVTACIIGLHFLLLFTDFVRNYRFFRVVKRRLPEGTNLTTPFGSGTVVSVQLTDTHLRLAKGEDLYVPHSSMRGLKTNVTRRENLS